MFLDGCFFDSKHPHVQDIGKTPDSKDVQFWMHAKREQCSSYESRIKCLNDPLCAWDGNPKK